ncbi:hypothetical protein N1851_005939 [Merluccius polli]|uniref:Uncharacterized protein n=1 Tax=Merluccius polli TaxID=89951 RepID=A0AA47PAR4_MERPO|nr:hypothetical protein N1851_005939 [Merluccius polli]
MKAQVSFLLQVPISRLGHTLNFVQSPLKNHQAISKCVAAARCLVEHFKKRELACTKLKNKEQQMGTPQHMLPEQWNLIEELSQALETFEGATVFLSGQQYVILSALPQLVQSLKKSIQRLHQSSVENLSSCQLTKQASSTAQEDKGTTSFLHNILGSSDSSTSDEEDEEHQLNQIVQKEVLIYFGENIPQEGESAVMVENKCSSLSNNGKAGKVLAVYSGNIVCFLQQETLHQSAGQVSVLSIMEKVKSFSNKDCWNRVLGVGGCSQQAPGCCWENISIYWKWQGGASRAEGTCCQDSGSLLSVC